MVEELEAAEITDIGKFSAYFYIGVIIFIPIMLNLLVIFMPFPIGTVLFYLLIMNIIAFGIVGLIIFIFFYYKPRLSQPTSVLISEQGIKIIAPKKQPFEIAWKEFMSMYLRVKGIPSKWDTVGEVVSVLSILSPSSTGYSPSDYRFLRIHFHSAESEKPIKKLDLRLFHDEKVGQIIQRIINFAQKLNKVWTIHEGTRKYYQLNNNPG